MSPTAPADTSIPGPTSPAHGRVDAATIAAVTVTGAALVFATVMAVKAKVDQPPSNYVTGQNGSYADLKSSTDSAHREAIFADAGFGLSIVAGITAAVLYFARSRDAPAGATSRALPSVSAAPLAGGAALVVQGSL
jgi:hypothetical protein